MARIRSVHPGQWRDQDFVECSFAARLLAIAIRNEADDSGLFEWKPRQIKMNVFPGDNVDMDALLAELVANNIIRKFEVEGRHLGAIRNFRLYQRPKTPNSIFPLTDEIREYVSLTGRKFGNDSEIDDSNVEPISPTPPYIGQQMKEEGDKMEEVGGIKITSGAASQPPKSTRAKTRRSLPEGFPFEPDLEWALAHWLSKGRADLCSGIADQAAQFRDHHAGKATMSADWPGSWRTWVRNAMNFTRAPRAVAQAPDKPGWKPLKVVGE